MKDLLTNELLMNGVMSGCIMAGAAYLIRFVRGYRYEELIKFGLELDLNFQPSAC